MLLKRLLMKREEITEKRKDTIFKAAVHCFNKSGYYTTTLDTIAAQAQMSKGGIYHYFKSKKDLFLELFDYRVNKYFDLMKSHIKEEHSPANRIRILVKKAGEILKENEDFYKFCLEFLSMGVRDPEIRKIMTIFYNDSIETFCAIINKGITCGEFKKVDAKKVARSLYLAVMGAFFTYFSVNVDFELSNQHAFDVENILRAISK